MSEYAMAKFNGADLARRVLQALRKATDRQFAKLVRMVDDRLAKVEQRVDETPSLDILRGEIDAALARIALPKGERGEDGKSVTLEDIRPLIELACREAALQAYRDTQVELRRAIAEMPKPVDGKDGASLEDFDVAIQGRRLLIGMRIGGKDISREIRLDIPQDAGVYRSGQAYEKSDIVTFGGSTFIAQCANPKGKPEESKDWRLMCKRGRDGKDAPGGDEE